MQTSKKIIEYDEDYGYMTLYLDLSYIEKLR